MSELRIVGWASWLLGVSVFAYHGDFYWGILLFVVTASLFLIDHAERRLQK